MRKMSTVCARNSSENNLELPPFVKGKLHGFCELFVEDIKWTTTKTYSLVKVAVKFWGENKARVFDKIEICNINSSRKGIQPKSSKTLLTVTYKVCTNHRLFQSYLNSCEPIIVEIFSSKTSDLIGRSSIEIPQRLYNLEQNHCARETTSSDIYSARNFKLGEIKISFEVKLGINCSDNYNTMFAKPFVSLKTNAEKDVKCKKAVKMCSKKSLKEDENKENLQVIGKSKAISVRDPKVKKQSSLKAANLHKQKSISHKKPSVESNKSTTTSSIKSISEKEGSLTNENYSKCDPSRGLGKLALMNYLTGQSISPSDENRVLNDLMQLSPSQSLIDDINMSCAPKIAAPENDKFLSVLVNTFEFHDAGFEDVKNYLDNFSSNKFIFKCALTSKLFGPRENMNFLSPVMDHLSHRIIFSRHARKSIKLGRNSKDSYLNFGFCIKSIGYKLMSSHLIGFTRISVEEILRNNSSFFRKCVVYNEQNVRVASVTLKIEITESSDEAMENIPYEPQHRPASRELVNQRKLKVKAYPSTSNDDCENHGNRNFEHKNMQTDESDSRMKNVSRKETSGEDHRDTEMVDVEVKDNNRKMKVYQGILFVEGLRGVKEQQNVSDYFITYEGFWNECQEMTEVSVNQVFNYLKQFAVIFDCEFLRKVQNNHMELKLWEKTSENSEKLIASTKVPLHQFYIAFKDDEMIEHLSTNKLPVISTDTWCNFVSPLSSELYCQAKVLLAIGSENQIDFLKLSRSLHTLQSPQQAFPREPEKPRSNSSNSSYDAQIKNKLTAFIESLSQKLPEPPTSCGAAAKQEKLPSASSVSSISSMHSNPSPQLRKTSDLLDSLQKALSQPPSTESFSLFQPNPIVTASTSNLMPNNYDCIKMMVMIEHAANLPKVVVKKCRNNKRKNKGTPPQRAEYEPHAYCTFEAVTDHLNENSLPTNAIKSHEGIVYCTNVVKGTHPEWNQSFEVHLPFDVIRNPQKKFVIKVWRKTSHDPATNTEAKPFEDSVIGFSAIDLSVLLTKLPVLSGYYNLVDFSGRTNGQIKVTLKPLEDIDKFRNPSSPLVPLAQPLNIDVGSSESSEGSSLLSRTLKRKFTELDEITQRLRARLFDVTGDENFDPDEEFERDLNTAVDEMEDVNDNKEDFGWLMKESSGNDLLQQTKGIQEELNKVVDSRPSTSKAASSMPDHRDVTGCSSETSTQIAIDDLLKKYDLDTLINPNIFKNILDPTLANSDSTPTLIPTTNENRKDNQDESDVTTVSSIASNDHVQMIQKALQRASLQEDPSSEKRCEPDGTLNDP